MSTLKRKSAIGQASEQVLAVLEGEDVVEHDGAPAGPRVHHILDALGATMQPGKPLLIHLLGLSGTLGLRKIPTTTKVAAFFEFPDLFPEQVNEQPWLNSASLRNAGGEAQNSQEQRVCTTAPRDARSRYSKRRHLIGDAPMPKFRGMSFKQGVFLCGNFELERSVQKNSLSSWSHGIIRIFGCEVTSHQCLDQATLICSMLVNHYQERGSGAVGTTARPMASMQWNPGENELPIDLSNNFGIP